MTRQKKVLTGVVLASAALAALVATVGTPTAAQDKPAARQKEPALTRFMRAKLDASSSVLEGLTTEDFDLIEKGAKQLQAMSAAEEWRVSNDAIYRQHSAEFRRIAEQLEAKAKEKQLDGAALAWMEATMNCIECHRWARAQMIAEAR